MSVNRYKAKSLETGKEIIGFAVECQGAVNKGQVFICPEVMSACYTGIGNGETHMLIGPFIRVDPKTLQPVSGEQSPKQNTKFSFLYRDASNYKTLNIFVLEGTLTAEEIAEIYACGEGDNFIAEQVGLYHDLPGVLCEDDHCWCEFLDGDDHGFEVTDERPTVGMTAQHLLEKFRAAKGHWDEVTYAPENVF